MQMVCVVFNVDIVQKNSLLAWMVPIREQVENDRFTPDWNNSDESKWTK